MKKATPPAPPPSTVEPGTGQVHGSLRSPNSEELSVKGKRRSGMQAFAFPQPQEKVEADTLS